jgi:hypothetical protein
VPFFQENLHRSVVFGSMYLVYFYVKYCLQRFLSIICSSSDLDSCQLFLLSVCHPGSTKEARAI